MTFPSGDLGVACSEMSVHAQIHIETIEGYFVVKHNKQKLVYNQMVKWSRHLEIINLVKDFKEAGGSIPPL